MSAPEPKRASVLSPSGEAARPKAVRVPENRKRLHDLIHPNRMRITLV